jgi:hypothetical protein
MPSDRKQEIKEDDPDYNDDREYDAALQRTPEALLRRMREREREDR